MTAIWSVIGNNAPRQWMWPFQKLFEITVHFGFVRVRTDLNLVPWWIRQSRSSLDWYAGTDCITILTISIHYYPVLLSWRSNWRERPTIGETTEILKAESSFGYRKFGERRMQQSTRNTLNTLSLNFWPKMITRKHALLRLKKSLKILSRKRSVL